MVCNIIMLRWAVSFVDPVRDNDQAGHAFRPAQSINLRVSLSGTRKCHAPLNSLGTGKGINCGNCVNLVAVVIQCYCALDNEKKGFRRGGDSFPLHLCSYKSLALNRSAYDTPLIAGDAWAPRLSEADRVRNEVQTAH